MHETDEENFDVTALAERELQLAERELALRVALEEADEERAEVLQFAEDVCNRLARRGERAGPDAALWHATLARVTVAAIDHAEFEARATAIRLEAIARRERLLASLEALLSDQHDLLDRTLETARQARDYLLKRRISSPAIPTEDHLGPLGASPSDTGADMRTTVMAGVEAGISSEALVARGPSLLESLPGPAAIRRQHRRKLEAKVDFGSDSNFFAGFSSDISEGGIFIATDSDLPLGTEVELRFTLPGDRDVACQGVVRWHRPGGPDLPAGLGVQFRDLSLAAQDAVQRFTRTRAPIFHED